MRRVAVRKGPSQKAVDELVASYLLDAVREHAGPDEELLDKVLALHDLAAEREASDGLADRITHVIENPLVRGAVSAMGDRVQRLVQTGTKVAADTQVLRARLKERLTQRGLDLAATIPLETALTNMEAVVALVELANDVLHPGSGLKRHIYDLAWSAFRKMVFTDPKVLERIEDLKSEVEHDPNRLKRIAKLIRKIGPEVVKDAYQRAAESAADDAAGVKRPARKAPRSRARKKAAKKKS
jgi:hypothetical protein